MRVDNMVVRLLDLLIAEWLIEQTIEEIARDEIKVALLTDVLDVLGPEKPEATERVYNLYEKVFLRDVWRSGKSNWRLPAE